MIQRLKNLSALKGKKRYIFFAWLAVELMSLPAAAHVVINNMSYVPDAAVSAVEIPTAEPGVSRYLVASNAGFVVKANDLHGDVKVNLQVSGTFGRNTRFGGSAQLPGAAMACAHSSGPDAHIYSATRKTAAQDGTAPERAVIFEFKYAPDTRPDFEFVPGKSSDSSPISCEETTA